MNVIVDQRIQQIVESRINRFLGKIQEECRIDSMKIHPDKSDFPIFHPANDNYFAYKYYENILEWYIRDELVTGILFELLQAQGKSIIPYTEDRVIRFRYSNEEFGQKHLFAFVLDDGESRIGYRYTDLSLDDNEFESVLKENDLDHIEIFDWSDTNVLESKKRESGVTKTYREKIFYVTVQGFFSMHLSDSIYRYYLKEVRDAVQRANAMIGFQTIPNLSLRYLSDFRTSVLKDLSSMELRNIFYMEFTNNGELTNNKYPLLHTDDSEIIDRRFYDLKLYESLAGDSPFARCFLTSEYLYHIFRDGNEHYFDYSAIVTGYFKSVELLLEAAMKATFNFDWHEELWIQCDNKNLQEDDKKDKANFQTQRKRWRARFTDANYKNNKFANEMGALIYFIKDNERGWYISSDGQKRVNKCLQNYRQGCRNEHLHKDIIDDISTVKCIRDNTLLCIYYIIGGYRFSPDELNDYHTLGAISDSYTRLYKRLTKIPSVARYFYMQFGDDDPIMAVRLNDQEAPNYDFLGNVLSKIEFVKVNSIPVEDYWSLVEKPTEADIIRLSRECLPTKMWWYNKYKGRVEIEW